MGNIWEGYSNVLQLKKITETGIYAILGIFLNLHKRQMFQTAPILLD